MDRARYLDCLEADFGRLRSVVTINPLAAVPTCPGWTVASLTHHVGEVYLHKTMAMRDGVEPRPWPPKELIDEDPFQLLDRAHTALLEQFAAHQSSDPSGTWYAPDQTVGFWIRRMAQETVIHRIDAELGAGQPVAAVPDDLARDGIDELLKVFVAYSVEKWSDYFTETLINSPGWTFLIATEGAAWRVRTGPEQFTVSDGRGDGSADVTISGPPAAVLRWVWNREDPTEASQVTVDGPAAAVSELRRCIVTGTQ